MTRTVLCTITVLLAVSATAGMSGGARQGLPIVGCRTYDGAASVSLDRTVERLPKGLPAKMAGPQVLAADQASKLAWYEGALRVDKLLLVLAPRGWKCSAAQAMDGNWDFKVVPAGAKPAQEVEVSGGDDVQGAFLVCGYFKSARPMTTQPDLCKKPRGEAVTSRSSHLVTVNSPAGTSMPLNDRVALLWYNPTGLPGDVDAATRTDCVLPRSENDLCDVILAAAERRQSELLKPTHKG